MNENVDLIKILNGCPSGTPFYSKIHGKVKFLEIDLMNENYPIRVFVLDKHNTSGIDRFSKQGFYAINYDGECQLVPSKDQQDWSKFIATWKKPKFDPKTLKVFDKVLVWHTVSKIWFPDFYSFCDNNGFTIIGGGFYNIIIPYNEETEYLVGTSDKAPEQYKYWED